MNKFSLQHWKSDLPASIVVFFVALPLCLGIALASGAPLFSGLIAGIIGGVVVGALSGSQIGVSGPAAGLTAIVFSAIATLGNFESFLLAVVLAGLIQMLFGVLRAGVIGYYFPSSVIKGMLTAIGIIIILKQIPHFFGYDSDIEGNMSFLQSDGHNTFSQILHLASHIQPGSALAGIIALAILLLWDVYLSKKHKVFQLIQGPLVAVVVGIVFYQLTKTSDFLAIQTTHLVSVPIPDGFQSFLGQFSFPDFRAITNTQVWITAFTIALVASLETLLCVEATDKLDPLKRVTPANRELLAQGAGNILVGLIGGLPVTQVIVRSSANMQSGGKTKLSAILHGLLLLLSVLLIPGLLNMIPLSVLAAILLVVGYKLAKPQLFKSMYKLGWKQFIPFIVTVIAIVMTDLLIGILLGLAVGVVVILIKSYQNSHFLHIEDKSNGVKKIKIALAEEVTFFNKGAIIRELNNIEPETHLTLDVRNTKYLDNDIIEILDDFVHTAREKDIHVSLVSERGTFENPEQYASIFNSPIKAIEHESAH